MSAICNDINILMNRGTHGTFWKEVQFLFIFFPNRRRLKFLKLNVIQQINKSWHKLENPDFQNGKKLSPP